MTDDLLAARADLAQVSYATKLFNFEPQVIIDRAAEVAIPERQDSAKLEWI